MNAEDKVVVKTEAAKETATVNVPKGKGKLKDMALVKTTKKHPTMPEGKVYKVHTAQVPYLVSKGFIETPKETAA
jgi:hypothetical protein